MNLSTYVSFRIPTSLYPLSPITIPPHFSPYFTTPGHLSPLLTTLHPPWPFLLPASHGSHPDKNPEPDAQAVFSKIANAYEVRHSPPL
ncbi:unnamed protein product [Closterium sp. NIES-54]